MTEFLQDVEYGARIWRKSLGLAAVAVLSIALGIAANTTVFSWIQEILLNPLRGATRPGEMVAFQSVTPSGEFSDSSYPDYRDYRDDARSPPGAPHGVDPLAALRQE